MSRFEGLPLALRNLRLAAGFTGTDVAKAIGTRNSSISRWETGKEKPGITNLGKLLDLYGATLSDLEDALALAQGRPLVQRSPRLPHNEGEVEAYLDGLLGPAAPAPSDSSPPVASPSLRTAVGALLLAAGRLVAEAGVGGPALTPVRRRRRRGSEASGHE